MFLISVPLPLFSLIKKGNPSGGFLKLEHLDVLCSSQDHPLYLQGTFSLILAILLRFLTYWLKIYFKTFFLI